MLQAEPVAQGRRALRPLEHPGVTKQRHEAGGDLVEVAGQARRSQPHALESQVLPVQQLRGDGGGRSGEDRRV